MVTAPSGVLAVLVRDAITGPRPRAADMILPVPAPASDTTILTAVATMRRARAQFAVVAGSESRFLGIVSLDDLLSAFLTANPH